MTKTVQTHYMNFNIHVLADSDVRTEVLAVDEPQCPTFTIIMFW